MRTVFQIAIIITVLVGAIAFCVALYYFQTHGKNNHDTEILVRVSQGVLKGIEQTTVLNNTKYYAFLGIPYAKPPIGNLRFKDPEPGGPWDGILDAVKEGNMCVQVNPTDTSESSAFGNEDCLFLNVFTPQFSNIASPRYPVMVWIHGGAFAYGSGNRDWYGPDLLIEHNVVIVTLNYRLGVLGFLSVLNDDAPGNAGLKDQVLALEWVKDNIYNFGGDPNNITIFGESAGSVSVHYHTISPMSKGLFHRAIMESGTALCWWAFSEIPVETAFDLGKSLGYKGRDKKNLITYLKTLPAETLTIGANRKFEKHQQKCTNLDACARRKLPFVPTAEKKGLSKVFLPEHPRNMIKKGKFYQVPVIIGVNSREGMLSLFDAFITTRDYGHNCGQFIPSELCLKNGTDEYNRLANEINEFFFQNASIDVQHLPEFCDICTDLIFTIGTYKTINYLRNFSNDDLYLYEFSFDGELGVYCKNRLKTYRKDLQIPTGVAHADEMGYIFHQEGLGTKYNLPSPEMSVINQMTSLWTNFAKYSSPNGKNVDVNWKSSNKYHIHYLNIGEKLILHDAIFFPDRYTFWDDVFKKY